MCVWCILSPHDFGKVRASQSERYEHLCAVTLVPSCTHDSCTHLSRSHRAALQFGN